MTAEAPTPQEKDGAVKKELNETQKGAVDELIPLVALLKAAGYSDEEVRSRQAKCYPGPWWLRMIDHALEMVTDEQVRKAKEEEIQSTIGSVTLRKADGLSDDQIRRELSRSGLFFVDEALKMVTPEQVDEEKRSRPQPRPPTPEQVKEDQLVEQLRREPGYGSLTREERELAEGILSMRWDGDSYVKIRHLLGDSSPEYLKKFDRAWVVTDFVKAEMLLAGRQPPRQTPRGRKRSKKNNRQNPRRLYLEARDRDIAVVRLWRSEGKCVICGKPATGERIEHGRDESHGHRYNLCPVCGIEPEFSSLVDVEYEDWTFQAYCHQHRPHLTDRRPIATLAGDAFLKERAEEARKETQRAKEKKERERRERQEEKRDRYSYNEDDEIERKMESEGEW